MSSLEARRRGRPTNVDLGRPPALSQVERNRIWKARRAAGLVRPAPPQPPSPPSPPPEPPQPLILVPSPPPPHAAWVAAANRHIGRGGVQDRYYTAAEDALLVELGSTLRDWSEIHRLMGRSSPAALKARFAKIEPVALKQQRTGRNLKLRPDSKRRPCMCCRKAFDSTGFHNRLCDSCRTAEGYRDEW